LGREIYGKGELVEIKAWLPARGELGMVLLLFFTVGQSPTLSFAGLMAEAAQ
jgi:hypothetical protein